LPSNKFHIRLLELYISGSLQDGESFGFVVALVKRLQVLDKQMGGTATQTPQEEKILTLISCAVSKEEHRVLLQ
jgi:hypothetical protein